jgi:hypothetical protein
MEVARLNMAFAWLWILLGFISGPAMGMHFHGENWMGGYTIFPLRCIDWDIFRFLDWG